MKLLGLTYIAIFSSVLIASAETKPSAEQIAVIDHLEITLRGAHTEGVRFETREQYGKKVHVVSMTSESKAIRSRTLSEVGYGNLVKRFLAWAQENPPTLNESCKMKLEVNQEKVELLDLNKKAGVAKSPDTLKESVCLDSIQAGSSTSLKSWLDSIQSVFFN